MRYNSMPGQPAMPPNPAAGAPMGNQFNYMNYGGGGVGSNQYQQLPPWMNVSPPGGALGPQNTPNFNFQPIGGWQPSPATNPSLIGGGPTSGINPFTHTQNPTQAQINANLPPGWMLPTSSPQGVPLVPYNPNQFGPAQQMQNMFNEFTRNQGSAAGAGGNPSLMQNLFNHFYGNYAAPQSFPQQANWSPMMPNSPMQSMMNPQAQHMLSQLLAQFTSAHMPQMGGGQWSGYG